MNSQHNQSSFSTNHNPSHSYHYYNNQRSKYVISYPAYTKKEKGTIELQMAKQLTWKPDNNSHNPVIMIPCDNIAQTKKDSKDDRELLFIKQKNDLINVFAFRGTNNFQHREQLYDMLNMSPDQFYEHEFKWLSQIEKKRILLLIEDDYLKLLFEEITNRREIIPLEDFWAFVSKMYPEKMSFSLMNQPIQPSRYDELSLIKNPRYPIQIDWSVKSRLLASYDDIRKLFQYNMKINQKEELFWREFIKNQDKNMTEIVGGLVNVFFTCEEEKIIKQNSHGNSSNKHFNHKSASAKMTRGTTGQYNKRYELIERHMNYYDNYENECIAIPEYDLNENKLSIEEEYNRKDIANIISFRNDYSSRKIDKLDYIPKQKIHEITHAFPNNITIALIQGKKVKQIPHSTDSSIKKYNDIMGRLAGMEMKQRGESPVSFAKTFKKINSCLDDTTKKKNTLEIPQKEYLKTMSIINSGNLIRDLLYIYETTKQKNIYIKEHILSLTKEIKKKTNNINQNSLTPFQRNQLDILLSFYAYHFDSQSNVNVIK